MMRRIRGRFGRIAHAIWSIFLWLPRRIWSIVAWLFQPLGLLISWFGDRSIPTRSIIGMIAATVAVFLSRQYGGMERHTFGHPGIVDAFIVILLWMLCITHLMIAALMWMQRDRWLPSDAAMFRFITAKALLWGSSVTSYPSGGFGVRIDVVVLYCIIALTTFDLDIRMLRRYVFRTNDEREYPEWDRISERRGDLPGRRWTDGRP
jgi:hypothetical protein